MKTWIWIWIVIAVVVLGGIWYWKYAPSSGQQDFLNYTMKEHTNLALHIHTTLNIQILGENYTLPEKIGISDDGMHVIHTHEERNLLHIEGPVAHQFYLKDFFTIWGKTFNETCIFENCVDDKHTLKMYVNGVETHQFENTPLVDEQTLTIVYAEN